MRAGLDDHAEGMTLEEIGQQFGITKERVRQLNVRAMKKLRDIAEEQDTGPAVRQRDTMIRGRRPTALETSVKGPAQDGWGLFRGAAQSRAGTNERGPPPRGRDSSPSPAQPIIR